MADTSSALIERAASAAAVQAARDAAACRALGGPLTIVGEAHGTPASVPLSDGAGDEIVARMAQVASDDHDYRVQLTELAARRGGLYAHALASLFDVERDTLGVLEAERRRKLDQDLLDETKREGPAQRPAADAGVAGLRDRLRRQAEGAGGRGVEPVPGGAS